MHARVRAGVAAVAITVASVGALTAPAGAASLTTVSGTVLSLTSIGQTPASGVTVTPSGGQPTTTDAQGNYSFDLVPRTYTFTFSKSGSVTTTRTVPVVDATVVDVTMTTPTIANSLSGTVTDTTDGAPLFGVYVTLLDPAGYIVTAVLTDGEGHYSMPGLTPSSAGGYTVRFALAGYDRQSNPATVDPNGTATDTADAALQPDTTPPQTSVTTRPATPTRRTTVSVGFVSNESAATFSCAFDGGGFVGCASPVTLSTLANGVHTFAVFATDAAGNEDPTPATVTFVVDTTAPDTTITAGPSGQIAVTHATWRFASTERHATFRCRLDNHTFRVCASPKTFRSLAKGPHRLQVYAVDAAGNRDPSPASRRVTVT